jgi:hypothetical protein
MNPGRQFTEFETSNFGDFPPQTQYSTQNVPGKEKPILLFCLKLIRDLFKLNIKEPDYLD